MLGIMLVKGDGADRNETEGVSWLQKAAVQGHAEAQYRLGQCYLKGNGVARDRDQAIIWLRRAATQGHVGAQKEMEMLLQ